MAIVMLIALAPSAYAQTVKKWVDENGVVHYGDRPPPSAKKTEDVRIHSDINVLEEGPRVAGQGSSGTCDDAAYREKRSDLMNEYEAERLKGGILVGNRLKQIRRQIEVLDQGHAICKNPARAPDAVKDAKIRRLEDDLSAASRREQTRKNSLVTYRVNGNFIYGSDGSSCQKGMGDAYTCSGGGPWSGGRNCRVVGDQVVCQ